MYTKRFIKEVVTNTAKRLDIPEEEVLIIYKSIEKSLHRLMLDPFVRCIKVPIIGSFVIRSYKLKTIYRKQTNYLNRLKNKVDGILRFDFNYYSNIKYHLDKIEIFNNIKKKMNS